MKSTLRSLLAGFGFLVGTALLVTAASLQAQMITINFENLVGMDNRPAINYPPGDPVPVPARLSEQFLATHGVVFSSGANAPYVAVVNVLGPNQLPSGTNGIGGVNASLGLDFSAPIDIAFFALGDKTVRAITDFVSVKTDLEPLGSGTVTCQAFDRQGRLLRAETRADNQAIIFSFARPGIHRLRVFGSNGTAAFDDLSFSPPTTNIPPQLTIETSEVRVCWETVSNVVYQLEYQSALTTNQWVPYGAPVVGNGATNCVFDSTVSSPKKFFRLGIVP